VNTTLRSPESGVRSPEGDDASSQTVPPDSRLQTPDSTEAAAGHAAIEEGRYRVRDQRPEGPVVRLEPLLVGPHELLEVLVEELVERGPLGMPGAVERRPLPLGDEKQPVAELR
jgi:hypothetical protein